MKKILITLMCIAFVSLASAVPQVIFTSVNLSITNGTYKLVGEGLNAQETFAIPANCSFSYERLNIPITFSRDIGENSTDVAILMRALSSNENTTAKWQACVLETANLNATVNNCLTNQKYETNFTQCKTDLGVCTTTQQDKSSQVSSINAELVKVKQQRMYLVIALIAVGLFCYNLYTKTNIKSADSPVRGLPTIGKM